MGPVEAALEDVAGPSASEFLSAIGKQAAAGGVVGLANEGAEDVGLYSDEPQRKRDK
jgi:hypothetical protein